MTFAIKKKRLIGDCVLYLGDSREVLPKIPDVDSVFADPQYGVGLGETLCGQERRKNQKSYNLTPDTPEFVRDVCVPIVNMARQKARSTMVTTGNRNMFFYDQPVDLGVWFNPAGTSQGKWGFNLVGTPIFYYGKDPYAGRGRYPSSPVGLAASREKIEGHPCPKPISFMKWAVNRISLEGETVLDPFMGSGTTLVACAMLGRRGIGIELDPEYFAIACERVKRAYDQPDLLIEAGKQAAPEQLDNIDLLEALHEPT